MLTLVLLLFLTALATALFTAYFLWRGRSPEVWLFALFSFCVSVWTLCSGLETLHQSLGAKLFFSKLAYLGVAPLPVFWLLFALCFTGRPWPGWRRTLPLFLIPALTFVFVWTTEAHGLVYQGVDLEPSLYGTKLVIMHGWWFWVHTFYSYAALFIGFVVLAYGFMSASRFYRVQYRSLLMGSTFPVLANLLFLGGTDVLSGVDPTPLSFALSCLVITPALVQHRLLDLMPVAQRAVFDTLPVAVVVIDLKDQIIDLNPEAQKLLEQPTGSAIGASLGTLLPEWPQLVADFLKDKQRHRELRLALRGTPHDLQVRIAELRGRAGQLAGHVIMAQDVTAQKTFERMAYHDPLTGLPNRRLLELEATSALTLADQEGWTAALLYLDLDNFKPVNDRYGHDTGDLLLRQVALRLQAVSRTTDVLVRFGGDEFVLFVQNVAANEAEALAERIVAKLAEPFSVEGRVLTIGVSVGVAFFPQDTQELSELIDHADSAMYNAKLSGTGVSVYVPDAAR